MIDRKINGQIVDLVFYCYIYQTRLCGDDYNDEVYDVEFEVPKSVKKYPTK